MSTAFIGEIRIMGFTFPPQGWAFCNGQIMPIQQYTALFSLLGTTYGGNGTTTFGLPNLQAQAAMNFGNGPGLTPRVLGEVDGSANVAVTEQQMPAHTHVYFAGKVGGPGEQTATPGNTAYLGPSNPQLAYCDKTDNVVAFAPQALTPAGGSQPHNNVQPLLALNYCIALQGIFPSRN